MTGTSTAEPSGALDRVADGVDPVDPGHRLGEVGGSGVGSGGVETAAAGGDQDVLGGRPVEPGVVDEGVGAAGLADPVVGVVRLLGRHRDREADGDDDEGEPGRDRAAGMGGAPPGGPRGQPGER
ncbi:hypothetical protein [Nocardioides sp. TF02-7]|uniref:hypothetical protein n=1 Tax=Nocardioides sp. TF02-7 TaxID=2917724 RepID=UPI001F06156E|nr:hypothetical protein [Nocardioides sp. TF02-7]UMG94259.1 hypothetical protein MF408_09705 [Nocardioides sp. TF02-7]